MFICSFCKRSQPAGTTANRVATHIRKVAYVFGSAKTTFGFEPIVECMACQKCVPPAPIVVGEIKTVEAKYQPTREQLARMAAMEEMSGEDAVAFLNQRGSV